jgi:hypothetical protein
MTVVGALALAMLIGSAGAANAQVESAPIAASPQTADRDTASSDPPASQAGVPPAIADDDRACEACPKRRPGRALIDATAVNVLYELANLARGQVTARITPKTWWANLRQGWVWDLDDFQVNQVGHPYQGSNYFNAGRSHGLNFYESAAVAAFGSFTWEYFGETNNASLNDFINTTLGGIALGEAFHRVAWLVRDTRREGRPRLWREIAATAIDPVTGVNRFISGDASRVSAPPPDLVPSGVTGFAAAGVLWRGVDTQVATASGDPFLEVDLLYGDISEGRARTPYDAFTVRLRFGGGAPFSEARVRGRLAGGAFGSRGLQAGILQTFDYQENGAFQTGSQSVDAALGWTGNMTPAVQMWLLGWGGVTILGAVDSLPSGLDERPERPPGSQGQGVSEGPRFYDYGPGSNFGAFAQFSHRRRPFAVVSYEGRYLYSFDGVRANHVLQRVRADLLAPVRGPLGLGASAEFFDRRTYFAGEADGSARYRFPQVRVYLTWSFS